MSEPTLTEAQRVDLSAAVCQYRYHGYQFEPLSAAIGDMLAEATQQARADAVAATTKLDDLRHRIEALTGRWTAYGHQTYIRNRDKNSPGAEKRAAQGQEQKRLAAALREALEATP